MNEKSLIMIFYLKISFQGNNSQVMSERDTHLAAVVHASRFFSSKSTIAAKLARTPP